jgi:peptide/nickel transport system substrate-binding protein
MAVGQATVAPSGKKGGELRIGVAADIVTMDPNLSGNAGDRQIYHQVFNTLVEIDQNLNILPQLAASWEQPDPKTYVFKLQQGVKFHDGTAFDAAAVKANFDRMMDPAGKSLRRGDVASIDKVTVVDAQTVRLDLKAPNAALLATLSDRAGMMVSPTAIQTLGADLARKPVGTGPFSFVEWVAGDHVTLQRNPSYWKPGLPFLDRVSYHVVQDPLVKLQGLQTGQFDIIDYAPPQKVQALKADSSVAFIPVKSLAAYWLWLNTTRPPFDNKAVRQSMALALDVAAIVKAVNYGVGVAANGPIPPSSWAYDSSIPVVQRDVAGAKAKLAAGGKASGIKAGFEISSSPDDQRLAQVLKAQLADAGIEMDIQLVDAARQSADSVAHNFDITTAGWSGWPDPDGNTFAHFTSKGGLNVGGYSNPQVDDLLVKAQSVSDHAQRREFYSQAIKILREDAPAVFWMFPDQPKAASLKVQGYAPIPDGMIRAETISFK